MIKKIEYENKVSIQNDESVAEKNKVTDANMNEIKEVNNNNADELEQAQKDIQTNTESIEQLKEKDTTQDKLIEQLQAENTKLKKEINSMQIPGEATGNPIHLTDSSNLECEIVVKGNAEQETRSGKNKYNATINKTVNNVSSIADIQYFTLNGTSSADGRVSFGLQTLKAGTYTVNLKCISGSYSNSANYPDHILKIWKGDSWNTFGTTINVNSTDKSQVSMTFTLEEDTEISLGAYYRVTDIYNNIKYAYQIVEGSNSDFDFEPYGASPSPDYPSPVKTVGQNGSVEIEVCNKNLLNLESLVTKTLNGITLTKNDDGSYMLNGTTTVSTGINIPINLSLKKGQAYTHSIHNSYKKGLYISLNNINITMIGNNYNNFKTFTLNEDKTYTNYLIWIDSGTTFNNYIVYPMVENGSTATDYIPHESYTKVLPIQKEFVKIGDVEDTFVKRGGKWYEEHYIGKRVFDGTGGWQIGSSSTDDYYIFQTTITNALNNNTTVNEIYCEQFIYDGLQGVAVKDYENIALNSTSHNLVRIWIKASRLTAKSLTAFKTWLSNNNVKVYYVLAEPELIECTAEQEEILNSFYTYKNVTNISVDGIGTLKVNYKKDLETLFNNINSALLS